jgi:hypothetical protein
LVLINIYVFEAGLETGPHFSVLGHLFYTHVHNRN